MRRIAIAATAAGALALPAAAQAHVSLHPNTLPAASNPTLYVRVPNEEDKANTVQVDMQMPPGFTDVSTELPPGWRVQKLTHKLAQPIQTDSGPVTEEVSELIWSAPRGGGIPPGSFLQFPILTMIPAANAGQTLTFKVIQTYSNGDIVRWIEPPDSQQHPAPTVNVTAKGGQLQDISGSEAGPPPGTGASGGSGSSSARNLLPVTISSKSATKGLGIVALVIGIVALIVGLGAAATARRRV